MSCDKCGLRYSSYCVKCKNAKTGLNLSWEQYLELRRMIREDAKKENKMRDRLIELLKGAETKVSEVLTKPMELEEWLGIYADYLLANGVIVRLQEDSRTGVERTVRGDG